MDNNFNYSQDYFIIVYDTNPDRERVKYEVDGNGKKQSCSYDRFFNFIRETISLTVANNVKDTLLNYNEKYILDRELGTIENITFGQEPSKSSTFMKYKDLIKEEDNKDKKSDPALLVNTVLKENPSWRERTKHSSLFGAKTSKPVIVKH